MELESDSSAGWEMFRIPARTRDFGLDGNQQALRAMQSTLADLEAAQLRQQALPPSQGASTAGSLAGQPTMHGFPADTEEWLRSLNLGSSTCSQQEEAGERWQQQGQAEQQQQQQQAGAGGDCVGQAQRGQPEAAAEAAAALEEQPPGAPLAAGLQGDARPPLAERQQSAGSPPAAQRQAAGEAAAAATSPAPLCRQQPARRRGGAAVKHTASESAFNKWAAAHATGKTGAAIGCVPVGTGRATAPHRLGRALWSWAVAGRYLTQDDFDYGLVPGLKVGLFTRVAEQLAREALAAGGEPETTSALWQAGGLGGRLVGLFPQAPGGGAPAAPPLLVLRWVMKGGRGLHVLGDLTHGTVECWVREDAALADIQACFAPLRQHCGDSFEGKAARTTLTAALHNPCLVHWGHAEGGLATVYSKGQDSRQVDWQLLRQLRGWQRVVG